MFISEIFSEHLFGHLLFAMYYASACRGLTEQACERRIVFQFSIVILLGIWWIVQLQKIRWLKWKRSSNEPIKIRFIKWIKCILPRLPTRHERRKMRKDFQAWLKLFLSP